MSNPVPSQSPLTHDPESWRHPHVFDSGNVAGEAGARRVLWLTLAAMAVEIAAGWWFHSMALLADGWHMSSHALGIGLSVFAYGAARRYARDPRFAFGSWKIEVLAGFASALFLLAVALAMVAGSVERLLQPLPVRYAEALGVAVLGLGVNLASAWLLHGGGSGTAPPHDPGHAHGHGHAHAPHDLNLRAAYLHVLADAATSVLAIAALGGGLWLGWTWLDPAMGAVGALLVASWAWGLARETARILLDCEMDAPVVADIRAAIEQHPEWSASTEIIDLHVWRVGRGTYAVVLGLLTHDPALAPSAVRAALSRHDALAHVSVEINRCPCPGRLPQ